MAKIIKDPIHGSIQLPSLLMKYIDTPKFQRLRRLRQLGPVHHVYPTMNHTRFEHSIGVAHLTGLVIDQVQSSCGISVPDRTKTLVQLAGLMHDTGHGAFSHLWDDYLEQFPDSHIIRHEDRSADVFYDITTEIERQNPTVILTEAEMEYVTGIITGSRATTPPWLGQIVNNTLCGIDVDKLDYICRDAYHGGLPGIDSGYIIANTRVDFRGNLAFRETAREAIKDVYHVRDRLHNIVYQHPTVLKFKAKYMQGIYRLFGNNPPDFRLYDDFSLETALRNDENTVEIMREIDTRSFLSDLPYIPVRTNQQTWQKCEPKIPFV